MTRAVATLSLAKKASTPSVSRAGLTLQRHYGLLRDEFDLDYC
jgi:hypothetical protein